MTGFKITDQDALPVSSGLGIGVFDSGSGGMVTAGFLARMVSEANLPASTVFFGDTKHLPYGKRDEKEVALFSDHIIGRLSQSCPVIGIACNTASAAWTHYGTVGKSSGDPKVFSVVEVAAKAAYGRARSQPGAELALGKRAKTVGILGTELTASIQSHAEAMVRLFRAEVSQAAGHELPLIPYEFKEAGLAPIVGGDLINFAQTPHVAVIREDEHAPGGTTRAIVKNLDLPDTLPEALIVVARDAQELVDDVDIHHVLTDKGDVKSEWRKKIHDYMAEHVGIMVQRGATSLILGCTHFEYFAGDFAALLPTMAARNAIISPSGALAIELLDAWLAVSSQHMRPVTAESHSCFSFSGDTPPESLFHSLGIDTALRVHDLDNASS